VSVAFDGHFPGVSEGGTGKLIAAGQPSWSASLTGCTHDQSRLIPRNAAGSLACFVGRWPCGSLPPHPGARVVSITSTGRHAGCPLDPDNPHPRWRDAPWRAYGQSKPANLHVALWS
jgi:hypothetical protein